MSDYMAGYLRAERWVTLAGVLHGLIDAHRMLKGDGDEYDRNLWRLAEDAIRRAHDA